MNKSKLPTVFLIISLIFLVAACGSAAGSNVEPTARPYTSEDVPAGGGSGSLEGNPENGVVVFEQYCSECHDIGEGVNIEGPSLFAAGTRLDYDYVKESILDPTEHLAYIEGVFEVDDTSMPTDFQEWMSAQQLEDVIAYVRSLE